MNATYARVRARLLEQALLEPATTDAQWRRVLRFCGVEQLDTCPDDLSTLNVDGEQS